MGEKQQESCSLADVSDIQHSRRENQEKVDVWHGQAVLHA